MQMSGRSFTSSSYRYGFNGKDNDNEVKGTGNQQDYGMRIYDPRIGKFISVDPLTKQYAYYSPYHFAGNTPIQAIDLDGLEPKSIVQEKSRNTQTFTDEGSPDDHEPIITKSTITIVTYKFTESATHLLSLVSGIPEADIQKLNIQNSGGGLLPAYNPAEGGGGMTFPGDDANSYRMNLTNNFFDNSNNKYGSNGHPNDVMPWLDLTSHEVGHIRDIQEIGGSTEHYFKTFIKEYAKAGSHDGNPREQRADVGRNQFRSFVAFVDSYYGKDKVKALFENKHNTDKDIKVRIDKWWNQYQKQIESENKKTEKNNK